MYALHRYWRHMFALMFSCECSIHRDPDIHVRTQQPGQRSGRAVAHVLHDVAFYDVLEGDSRQRVDSGGDGAAQK